MVVSEPERAVEELAKEGIVSKLSEVLAVDPDDRRGSLNDIFTLLGNNGINIDYIYSFLVREDGAQLFVIKVTDQLKAQELLLENGVRIIKNI